MKVFTETASCTSGVHCATCRDREGGRSFRTSLGNAFTLPADAPDFACPHGKEWGWKSPTPPPAPSPGPGDVVKSVLARMGYAAESNCGCQAMRAKMNQWGWWGCWKNRSEIVAWFTANAKKAGVEIDAVTILRFIREAWRERRGSKPAPSS